MTVLLPAWLQNGAYTAELDRQVGTGLLTPGAAVQARGGVRYWQGTELQVTATAPATMQVTIKPGVAWVQGGYTANQGAYVVTNDSDVTLAIGSAHATLARIDLVVLEVLDQSYSGASNLGQIRVVAGTAAGSPVAPTVTGSYIVLGQVRVSAAVTSIAASAITDVRPFMAAAGGVLPVVDAAARLALTGVGTWQSVLEVATGRVYQWSAGTWEYQYGGTPPVLALTPASGWFNWTGVKGGGPFEDLRVTKVAGIVYVTGFLGNTSSFTNASTMFTLPVGYRPERRKVVWLTTGSNVERRLDIYPTGLVQAWPGVEGQTHKAQDYWTIDISMNIRNNTTG